MVLSVPVIALGATLGTATSILALCGVTCLCRHMHPKKGVLQRDRDPDPEKARPGVLRSAQQVSGRGASAPRARLGSQRRLQLRGDRTGGAVAVLCATKRGGEEGGGRARGPAEGSGRPGAGGRVRENS